MDGPQARAQAEPSARASAAPVDAGPKDRAAATSLPQARGPLIGRGEAIQALTSWCLQHRLVSIVGPGGMGKTCLAIAVARELSAQLADGVHFVDLARHASAGAMARELAVTLGLEASPGDAMPALLERLRGTRLLIVLDCCEVAIDAAASLAEAVVAAAPDARVLATSREALNARDEWVHRIEPLGCPPPEALPTWLLASYPALQLFVAVAGAGDADFRLDSAQALVAGAICRRLDGSPLAIRLVAAHVARLGLDGVASQIDRAVLDWRASPAAAEQARHQSLEAVLDWSFHLLSPDEQRVFCSLAAFRSHFDLDAAVAVAGGDIPGAGSLVLDLQSKSLLVMHNVGGDVTYRFLDTTRSYAERALAQMPPCEVLACRVRHANFLVRLLQTAEHQWDLMALGAWRRRYAAWTEDVRAALQWAFSDEGDIQAGVALTLAAMALADQTNLIVDYGRHARRALTELQAMSPRRPELEMRLHAAPFIRQMGDMLNRAHALATLTRAQDLGRDAGTVQAQLGCLLALWAWAFQNGNYREAVDRTARIQELADARGDMVAGITAMRTRAQNLHFLGDHAGAEELALRICARRDQKLPLAYMPSPVSMSVSMRIVRARIHWLAGRADQAWKLVDECLALAEDDHPISICQTWAVAHVPLAIWCGWQDQAERGIEALAQLATHHAYAYWKPWCGMFGAIAQGRAAQAPEAALQGMHAPDQAMLRDHIATMQVGDLAHGGFERASRGEVGWSAPEALRMRAEHLWADGSPDQAHALLEKALRLARSQGALAWELRAAMSGLRMARTPTEAGAARQLLETVRARFVEGLDTHDVREADRLLSY